MTECAPCSPVRPAGGPERAHKRCGARALPPPAPERGEPLTARSARIGRNSGPVPGDKSARLVFGRLRPPRGGAPETEPPVSVRAAGAVDPVPRGPSVDWPALLPDVARRLLGEPHPRPRR